MAGKTINLKGSVEKLVRANGKTEAQILVTIPADRIADIPMGKCNLSIESTQQAMFPEGNGPVRGR